MYTVQCTMYNVQCTFYSVQCTVYSSHFTMFDPLLWIPGEGQLGRWGSHYPRAPKHSTLKNIHFTLYNVHYTLYAVHCTLYTAYCTLYTVYYALYTVDCTLYTVHYTLYTVQSVVKGEANSVECLVWHIYVGSLHPPGGLVRSALLMRVQHKGGGKLFNFR